jgi:hypothetical protein
MQMTTEDKDHLYMARAAAPSSFFVLNQDIKWLKFNKHIIIKGKLVDIYNIFMGSGNMQDVVEDMVVRCGGNNRSTNMRNLHSCPIYRMDLIGVGVGIMHSELVKFTGDMVGGTTISEPIVVGGGGAWRSHRGTLFKNKIFIEAIPTCGCRVPDLEAGLACGRLLELVLDRALVESP